MTRARQARSIRTRETLLSLAREKASAVGYGALRVEDIVAAAGVAKGTFFSHFKDKDALMDILIAERLNALLDGMEKAPKFQSVDELVAGLMPYLGFVSSERYVFDLYLRLSGALKVEEIGEIAESLVRLDRIVIEKLDRDRFRQDVSPELLSEGIQAFCISSIALGFCALHSDQNVENRLETQLKAWLCPG
ncbi:TetR/AcrR family transcriptional regulator [Ponticoccus alexandrii]|uniref:TetR family transcriptional regulator n=1 Tax=Ponticoccus alexandrii TaxID=1943633 RepID=A0ABX7F7S5_9RHOB|nr:TetR/AcrR family transcriptional regulator [Ponticoccus alexandrii]ETA51490.1 hypothetical protein P279_13775 [Rhodobacteraceae bacterium PD-2]QRF66529.1 TetR family transcriptional regulator [Ponticoccus alexandrii]